MVKLVRWMLDLLVAMQLLNVFYDDAARIIIAAIGFVFHSTVMTRIIIIILHHGIVMWWRALQILVRQRSLLVVDTITFVRDRLVFALCSSQRREQLLLKCQWRLVPLVIAIAWLDVHVVAWLDVCIVPQMEGSPRGVAVAPECLCRRPHHHHHRHHRHYYHYWYRVRLS